MNIISIIPARMGSSRFPGKPMADILGIPMIGHVYKRVKLNENLNEVYIATCDEVIYEYIVSIGGKAIMTDNCHERCSDRCAEAMIKIEKEIGILPKKDILDNIDNIYLIEPLEYPEFVYLMSKSYLILTDSGGIQEEAPSLGKPVLVMRDTTERPEALEAGTVKLVGTDKNKIITEVENLLQNQNEYDKMSKSHNPYGDGMASKKIIEFLEFLRKTK